MNKPIHILLLAAILLAISACSKGDDAYYEGDYQDKTEPGTSEQTPSGEYDMAEPQSISFIATLHKTGNGDYYLQIDASMRVYPANFQDLCAVEPDCPCRIVGQMAVFDRQMGELGQYGLLDWFDFVEKGPVVNERGEGDDGVDVLADWMTSLEDGFLTLHIQTWWGYETRRHAFRLVAGINPDDPYELLLQHFANNDAKSFQADALVCFDLLNALPRPNDPDNTTVTLKWTNDTGQTESRSFPFAGRY